MDGPFAASRTQPNPIEPPATADAETPAGREAVAPKPTVLRRLFFLYPVLLALCGIGYAKYSSYQVDGDAVSFMDIADAMRAHHWALAVNGYWNPGYAAALAVAGALTHPSRWNELQTFYWVNFWIFLGCIAACIYFVRGLTLVRERFAGDSDRPAALSGPALQLAALALLFYSFQRELNLGAVRADSLLLFFFLLAAGILLRIQAGARLPHYALLGLTLGLAYLTKSFAFVPSGFLLAALFVYGLTRKSAAVAAPASALVRSTRGRIVTGAILAGLVFIAVAGPYIFAISRQRGRPTTGESARMNYSFFVDLTPRWHEAFHGDLGHATADFKHPEQVLLASPPVFSYAAHPEGTYPLWFDPAYWTDTLQPHFWLKGHVDRAARNVVLLVRFVVGHLEGPVLLAVLLLAGCCFERRGAWFCLVPVLLWGLLMIAIYFPVDIQDRYLTGAWLMILVPLLAMLRRSSRSYASHTAAALVILLALLAVADAASDLGERRRLLSVTGYPRGAYDPQVYQAARGLNAIGITPGSTVACFGNLACYNNHYWARLAQTPIRAEIEVPDGSDPGRFWSAQTDQAQIVDVLRKQGVAAIVANFVPSAHIPAGWRQLEDSNYYAYPLGQNAPVSR